MRFDEKEVWGEKKLNTFYTSCRYNVLAAIWASVALGEEWIIN